jgi:hypothetical protein
VSISRLLNISATIIRRRSGEEEDDRGNTVSAVEEVEARCWIEKQTRRAQEEAGQAGELSDTLWTAYFAAGIELGTGDAVVIEGQGKYELVGDPWEAINPRTGVASHIEANLRRTAASGDPS